MTDIPVGGDEEVYATGQPHPLREIRVQLEPETGGRLDRYVDITVDPWFAADGAVRG